MSKRYLSLIVSLILSCGVATTIFAQAPAPRPTAGDLREEQRVIGNAYLGDAEFCIKRARERLGSGNNQLAQQSGLWALEQIAYAKRKIERHAPKIEEAGGLFGRASEGTRKDLRESYGKVRDRYVDIEERVEGLAEALKKAGMPILSDTLAAVRSSNGDGAVQAVADGLSRAGEKGQGDKVSGDSITTDSGTALSAMGNSATISLPGGGSATVGPNGLTIGSATLPGVFDPASNTLNSPTLGRVDIGSTQTNRAGTSFMQSDKGVVVTPPGVLIPGAKLGAGGQLVLADGTRTNINEIIVNGSLISVGDASRLIDLMSGKVKSQGADHSGSVPSGVKMVGANGQPVVVDGDAPPFENGQRSFVRKTYIGARDTILQREQRVAQKLVEASGTTWKVNETIGETRTWSLRIDFKENESLPGKLTGTIAVADAAGTTGITVTAFHVQDDSGVKASAQRTTDGAAYSITFAKSGEYTAEAEGVTDWGSRFKFDTTLSIGVK